MANNNDGRPEKAYHNEVFLGSRAARPLRILAEYLQPESRFDSQGISDTIVFFGSARLIARGKYGVSIWVHLRLSKFSYGQPTHRLLRDWSDYELTLLPGTLTGGLRTLAPLFEPLEEALLCRLQSENRWPADETRWMVFAETEGKIGHRWYLWVFHSESVIHFVLDPT